jgi:hypothetical protein
MKRLTIREYKESAITVQRVSTKAQKLVYIMSADKKWKYKDGRSRIVYIGTTKRGISRMAASVATRAHDILGLHGVEAFTVHVITCKPRQHVKTWHKLERALILTFRELYGEVPECNSHGKKMKLVDEYDLFSKSRLRTVLEDLS